MSNAPSLAVVVLPLLLAHVSLISHDIPERDPYVVSCLQFLVADACVYNSRCHDHSLSSLVNELTRRPFSCIFPSKTAPQSFNIFNMLDLFFAIVLGQSACSSCPIILFLVLLWQLALLSILVFCINFC